MSEDVPKHQKANGILPEPEFLMRRVRLKGNSAVSIPMALVLVFPCIVIILILVLFLRHPSSPGRMLMPTASPPEIR